MTQIDPTFDPTIPTEESVDESLRRVLQAAGFGVTDETPPEVPEPVAPEPEPEPAPPATLRLPDGRELTVEDALRYLEFEEKYLGDPRFLQTFTQTFAAPTVPDVSPTPPPPATPVLPPEYADELTSNPVLRYLADQLTASQASYTDLAAKIAAQNDQLTAQAQSTLLSQVRAAQDTFMASHNITQPEMDRIHQAAVQTINFDRLVSLPVNPYTNKAEVPDPVRRMSLAYDATYRAIPEFFDRELERRQEAAKADTERKAKLTALSSTGSTPPAVSPRKPETPQERQQAFRDEIAAHISGVFIQPE